MNNKIKENDSPSLALVNSVRAWERPDINKIEPKKEIEAVIKEILDNTPKKPKTGAGYLRMKRGKEYQTKVMRTNDGLGTERIMNMADNLEQGVEDSIPDTGIDLGGIINGLFGLSGEVGELTDMVKKWIFHESNFDEEHAKKELGDVMWYVAMICESFNWSLDEIMQMNIEKLEKRYPDGFDVIKANNRSPEDV